MHIFFNENMSLLYWIVLWWYYIFPYYEKRRLEDKFFWNYKMEICDEYYHKPKKNYEHKYYTRSKAKRVREYTNGCT